MNLTITGHHLEITPAIRGYIEDKIGRIKRHFDQVIDLSIILTVDKLNHKAEVNLHLRGKLVVTLPPEVTLNGKPDRLSPGARIHDTNNLLVMSGGLINRELVVNYVRDGHGLIHEVWILTPQEAAMKRPARPA